MAAIDRTAYNALVDDDGSNLVGTPWTKNIVKTVLLDPIDAAILTVPTTTAPLGQVLASAGVGVVPVWTPSPTLTSLTINAVTIASPGYLNGLDFRNGTSQVSLSVMNTWTSTAIWEGLGLGFSTNQGYLLTQSLGAGTSPRPLLVGTTGAASLFLRTNNVNQWEVTPSGNLVDLGTHTITVGGAITAAGGITTTGTTQVNGELQVVGGHRLAFTNGGYTSTYEPVAAGQVNLVTGTGAAGIGLDFGTDNILKIRNRAQTAYADIIVGTLTLDAAYFRFKDRGFLEATSDGIFDLANNAGSGLTSFSPHVDNTGQLGLPGSRWNTLNVGVSIAVGTNPASTGIIRLANNSGLVWRNAANTADLSVLSVDAGNTIQFGASSSSVNIYSSAGQLAFAGSTLWINSSDDAVNFGTNVHRWNTGWFGTGGVAIGTNPSTVGSVRLANNNYVFARNAANTGNLALIGLNPTNQVWIDANAAGTLFGGSITLGAGGGVIASYLTAPASTTLQLGADAGFQWQITTATRALSPLTDNTYDLGDATHRVRTGYFSAMINIGNNPAQIGDVRLWNNGAVMFRNAANTADQVGLTSDGASLILGFGSTVAGYTATASIVLRTSGAVSVQNGVLALGSAPSTTGALRLSNNTGIYWRNQANTVDYQLLALNASDQIIIGNTSISTILKGQLVLDAATPLSLGGPILFNEMVSAPGAPPATVCAVFARNNGGKTELIAYFNGGGVVRLAIQP